MPIANPPCLTCYHPAAGHERAPAAAPRLLQRLRLWRDRARERRDLARLDERELHDLGLSRSLIHNEINKPFWRG